MKYIKLFENFENEIDPKLKRALTIICVNYKEECLGGAVHLSEEFDEGQSLLRYAEMTDDSRIKSILSKVAELCQSECEGNAEHIVEYISDEDCDYIANFLGISPLKYEEDWTEEEEMNWMY